MTLKRILLLILIVYLINVDLKSLGLDLLNVVGMILVVMVLIGAMCIGRETSLFGPRKRFPIDWGRRPWDSFETVCAYFTTLVFFLAFAMFIIRIINENI
jgi:hypothetical protein